jgi:hypothetical protein
MLGPVKNFDNMKPEKWKIRITPAIDEKGKYSFGIEIENKEALINLTPQEKKNWITSFLAMCVGLAFPRSEDELVNILGMFGVTKQDIQYYINQSILNLFMEEIKKSVN